MSALNDLEQELNISYPEIYKNLYTNGMLIWDESSTNWYEDTFPKLKENSLLLLFGGDIEISNPMESQSEIEEILNREKIDINEKFRLVPFAKKWGRRFILFSI